MEGREIQREKKRVKKKRVPTEHRKNKVREKTHRMKRWKSAKKIKQGWVRIRFQVVADEKYDFVSLIWDESKDRKRGRGMKKEGESNADGEIQGVTTETALIIPYSVSWRQKKKKKAPNFKNNLIRSAECNKCGGCGIYLLWSTLFFSQAPTAPHSSLTVTFWIYNNSVGDVFCICYSTFPNLIDQKLVNTSRRVIPSALAQLNHVIHRRLCFFLFVCFFHVWAHQHSFYSLWVLRLGSGHTLMSLFVKEQMLLDACKNYCPSWGCEVKKASM